MLDRRRLRTAETRSADFARKAVPGLITGGAGDDPAGVMTYTVIGATTGLSQLWLLVLSTPMLAAATTMAARVALVTNSGLAAVIEKRYGRPAGVLIVLLLAVTNIATIAADVAGAAAVLGMFTHIRWEFFVPLILLGLTLVMRSGYSQMKQVLTGLTFVLFELHRSGGDRAAGLGNGRACGRGAAGLAQLQLAGSGSGVIGDDYLALYALLASQ